MAKGIDALMQLISWRERHQENLQDISGPDVQGITSQDSYQGMKIKLRYQETLKSRRHKTFYRTKTIMPNLKL